MVGSFRVVCGGGGGLLTCPYPLKVQVFLPKVSVQGGGGGSFYLESWLNNERERNVLFNDALNTFYLWSYGVRHMVKDHSDSEKGNPPPPHRLLLSINS